MILSYRIGLAILPFMAILGLPTLRGHNAPVAQSPSGLSTPNGSRKQAASPVLYEVTPDMAAMPPLLRVAITFDVPTTENKQAANDKTQTISLQMPVWCPGDYHVQNFGKYVQNLQAADALVSRDQRLLPVAHPDVSTWTVQTEGAKRVRVEYALPQMPPGYFSENVFFRPRYVFVNGASALLYLTGHKTAPTRLVAHLPEGWKAETPLPVYREPTAALQNDLLPAQNGHSPAFDAPDYDTLADSPLVMAQQDALETFDLRLDDAPMTTYRSVYFGGARPVANAEAINKMLLQIARAETHIMGGAPNQLYEFLLEVNGRGGGLEHLNACRLPFWPGASVEMYAPFVAHEFFHQWNVKRIRPSALGPFDYIHPPRTRNLWFAEGVTDYYAYVAVRRAGLSTESRFLAHWQRAIAGIQHNPARLTVTADQASWRVWESGTSQGDGGLSYYDKGALIGLCLDLKIRHVTNNRRSLDDVMKSLYKQCAPPNPGYGEDDIRATVNKIAGQDLTEFYNLLARSTQEMPFAECLAYAGLDAELRPLPQATPEQIALHKQWTAQSEGNRQD